ncbi:MAG: response regulator [Opitutae bacterium]|nr:response regulator [Opitutae bacterium]
MLATLALEQDYVWFLAAIVWGALWVGWLTLARTEREWRWLPWAAGAGCLSALVELVAMAWPGEARAWVAPRLVWEEVQIGLTAALLVGWTVELGRQRLLNRWTAILTVVLIIEGALFRSFLPKELAWFLPGFGAALALFWARAQSEPVRAALAVCAVGLSLTNTGPVAEWALVPRRWAGLDASSLAHAAVHLAWAATIGWIVARRFGLTEARLDRRPLFYAGLGWLVAGLALASVLGARSRVAFESAAVSRARLEATLLDRASLARLVGRSDFRLDKIYAEGHPDGALYNYGSIRRLRSDEGWRLECELVRIEQANPDVLFACLTTLRDGWLVMTGSRRQLSAVTEVGLARRHDPQDEEDWRTGAARYLAPHATGLGLQNYARAPVFSPSGEMLGWLALLFPIETWVASQTQTRLLVFVVVGLGLVLAGMTETRRIRAREQERARAQAAAALEADRMKTAFLAKVSHELRTPIQSIMGYGELLRGSITDPLARARVLALRQHTDLMLRLVNDLLDLSAMQMGAFRLRERPARLGETIGQTVESLRPRAEAKGLSLSFELEPGTPEWAQIDSERVRQITLNLVGNAIKFTDRGGVDVRLGCTERAGVVCLAVGDTGPGIPAELAARLFQPFVRLEPTAAKEGTGLGLALADALCRSMRGGIALAERAGGGAVFNATFEARPCLPPDEPSTRSDACGRPLQGLRILIAEDNTLVRELFASYLGEMGARCHPVVDGAQALEVARREALDCCVLDLSMPCLDGWQTAAQLQARRAAGLRIVGVSAHANASERERALAAGFDEFLAKPVELGALAAAVRPERATVAAESAAMSGLHARLRAQFRLEAPARRAAALAAQRENDALALRQTAHWFCNSASVLGDDALRRASSQLEDAALSADSAAVERAWQACEQALRLWLNDSVAISDATPASHPKNKNQPS